MTRRLLATKFHFPPQRTGLVARPRLMQQMTSGLQQNNKLTLISAPAGYGKTTLLADWIAHLQSEIASHPIKISFLSLDEADNDTARFLTYFLAAFYQVDASLGESSQSLMDLPKLPPVNALLDDLLNGLAAMNSSVAFVLDEYHCIMNPEIHAALEYFLDHQPSGTHIFLSTRSDPPLSLARLRARGQMIEIRARDLRFNREETRQFFELANLPMAENALYALDERTEGWAAGLQLAALALQHQSDPTAFIENFRGSHRYVLDYLAGEVLRQQNEEMRTFLVKTSLLNRFNAELCNALTGRADSQTLITQLEAANLFIIALDDEQNWYRYHHLFADYLRNLLSKPEQIDILQKAALWHEANHMIPEAVQYALACKDHTFAAELIERALERDSTWSALDLGLFTSWMKALPDQVLHSRPHLCLDAALIFYIAGRLELSETYIQDAEQVIQSLPQTPDNNQMLALARLYRGLIASVRGEFRQAIDQITTARSQIRQENHIAHVSALFSLGQAYYGLDETRRAIECYLKSSDEAKSAGMLFPMVNSRCAAARILISQGELSLAEHTCWQAIDFAHGERLPQLGLAWSILGCIALERNDLASAEKLLQDGLKLSRQAHLNDDVTWGLIFLARLRVAQDDASGSLAAMYEMQSIVKAYGVPRISLMASSYLARIHYLLRQKHLAAQWATEYQSIRKEMPIEHADLTLARILLATNQFSLFTGIIHPLLEAAAEDGRKRTCLEASLLLGMYHRARGDMTAALKCLENSVQMAAPEGYIRIFLEEGQPILELLPKVRFAAPELVDAVLNVSQPPTESRSSFANQLPEPLSEQEMRVLKLIVTGKSNAEIAADLFISIGTAKWHVHNILQKLGVSNRSQAIARARELGL